MAEEKPKPTPEPKLKPKPLSDFTENLGGATHVREAEQSGFLWRTFNPFESGPKGTKSKE